MAHMNDRLTEVTLIIRAAIDRLYMDSTSFASNPFFGL
jgi:hypothetical protein